MQRRRRLPMNPPHCLGTESITSAQNASLTLTPSLQNAPKLQRKNRKVLIIEDDAWMSELLEMFLKSRGFEVQIAQNGFEALEHLSFGTRPKALILDLVMPVMDGVQFLKIKNANPLWETIPTVVASASEEIQCQSQAERFLKKPLDLELLCRALENYCSL
jgi:CheY-like chemotaxis protein